MREFVQMQRRQDTEKMVNRIIELMSQSLANMSQEAINSTSRGKYKHSKSAPSLGNSAVRKRRRVNADQRSDEEPASAPKILLAALRQRLAKSASKSAQFTQPVA